MESQARVSAVSNAAVRLTGDSPVTQIGSHTVSRASNGAYVVDATSTFSDAAGCHTLDAALQQPGRWCSSVQRQRQSSTSTTNVYYRLLTGLLLPPSQLLSEESPGQMPKPVQRKDSRVLNRRRARVVGLSRQLSPPQASQ